MLLIIAIAIALIIDGVQRAPTGAAEGTALNVPTAPVPMSATTRPTIRVATFNIHGGIGSDDRKDLARTALQLSNFDVVGLQEVHGTLVGSPQNDVQGAG